MSDLRNRNTNKTSSTPTSSSSSKKNGKTSTENDKDTTTNEKIISPPSSTSSNKKVSSTTKPVVPVENPPKDDDEESYGGYQGSDDDEREYEDDYLNEDNDEDNNDKGEDGPVLAHDRRKPDHTPKPLTPIPVDDGDDNLVIIAALLGFFLCLGCGGILAYTGIQSEFVMGGGMLGLLVYLIYLMMCPTCGRKRIGPMSMVEGVTPTSVFIIAGCIGVMLGAMFGGVYRNIQIYK